MKAVEKMQPACALAALPTPVDSDCALDLARMVRQPRHAVPPQSAVSARMLVGALRRGEDADAPCLCMDVDGQLTPVQVADSCLVQAQAGDWVHAVLACGVVWVLSVLKKHPAHRSAVRALNFGEAELHISAKKIRIAADQQLDLQAEFLTQSAQNRQSHIDGTDSAHVGNSIVHADSHLSLHARSAMVTAASLLKVDAAQIHMG